jgi:uncharacterized LabA/DUF88 family protein
LGKNVAVFVDVANIFYAAKAAGVDIDYVTLLKSATAGRDFVRAYAYTGLDPENENQRNVHQFLARHSYKVVSKDIRKYGDGKVKANLDIELVVDMMKTARNLDIAVVVSGDGDFASAIRAVQEMGVRVEVISFRGNTSSDLIDVADLFTDITQIAKVDKSSTRSGRRVADDEEDLSMTEVPEKQSEGSGRGRARGRLRGRADREEVATPSRGSRTSRASRSEEGPASTGGQLIALPGERLSRAATVAAAVPSEEAEEAEELDETTADGDETAEGEGQGEGRRRRRRRGGRGRGRGRRDAGQDVDGVAASAEDGDGEAVDGEAAEDAEAAPTDGVATADGGERPVRHERPARRTSSGDLPTPFDDMDALSGSRPRRPATPFGSVWDAQLGTASRPAAGLAPIPEDEEDLDEPEIPEYLLAERRRSNQGGGNRGGRGGRGGSRGAYAAAIERERYGGSRGGMSSRFAEPSRPGRTAQPSRGGRNERPERTERAPRAAGQEWSEVPPELQQMVLAQMQRAQKPSPAPSAKVAAAETPTPDVAAAAPTEAPAPKRRTARKAAPAAQGAQDAGGGTAAETPAEAPKRRPTRRKAAPAEG